MKENLYLTNWDVVNNTVYKILRREHLYYNKETKDYITIKDDNDLITIKFNVEKKQSFFGRLLNCKKFFISPYFCISIDYLNEQDIYLNTVSGIAYLSLIGNTQKSFNANYVVKDGICYIFPIEENNNIYDFIAKSDSFSFKISFNAKEKNKKYEFEIEQAFDSMIDRISGIYVFHSPLLDNQDRTNLIAAINTLKSYIKY